MKLFTLSLRLPALGSFFSSANSTQSATNSTLLSAKVDFWGTTHHGVLCPHAGCCKRNLFPKSTIRPFVHNCEHCNQQFTVEAWARTLAKTKHSQSPHSSSGRLGLAASFFKKVFWLYIFFLFCLFSSICLVSLLYSTSFSVHYLQYHSFICLFLIFSDCRHTPRAVGTS